MERAWTSGIVLAISTKNKDRINVKITNRDTGNSKKEYYLRNNFLQYLRIDYDFCFSFSIKSLRSFCSFS